MTFYIKRISWSSIRILACFAATSPLSDVLVSAMLMIKGMMKSGFLRVQLTVDGTEAPALVLGVVVGGGAPQVAVLAPDAGAVVKPLAVVKERQVAWAPVRVALDRVDVWGAHKQGGGVFQAASTIKKKKKIIIQRVTFLWMK